MLIILNERVILAITFITLKKILPGIKRGEEWRGIERKEQTKKVLHTWYGGLFILFSVRPGTRLKKNCPADSIPTGQLLT